MRLELPKCSERKGHKKEMNYWGKIISKMLSLLYLQTEIDLSCFSSLEFEGNKNPTT